MNSKILNIIVTGCNRGLGKDLITLFCEKSLPHNIILAVRTAEKGIELIDNLKQAYPESRLFVQSLDISNSVSLNKFVDWFSSSFKTLDILVNNAGVGFQSDLFCIEPPSEEIVTPTMSTNVYGLIDLTEKLLPILSENGKIVNISSGFGSLSYQPEPTRNKLMNPLLKTSEIIELAKSYETQVKKNNVVDWSVSSYKVSKTLVNAYTRIALKNQLIKDQTCIYLSPGWCQTDMGTSKAPNSIRSGTEKIYFAIFETGFNKDSIYNGKYLYDNKISEDF